MKIKIEERASPLILTFETDREMGAIRWAIEVCRREYPRAVYAEEMQRFETEINAFYRNRAKERLDA